MEYMMKNVFGLFEVKLQGAQGDREAEVFQVSNDDTAVVQRWLEDKQPEEKTNTDCLVKEQEKEYETRWKIKTGNVRDFCNQRSTQQCKKSEVAKHLGVAVIQQQNGLVKKTNVTFLAKTPIDMLGIFAWLASIKQGMLEPVKVKCIFLGYRKGIVGNKLWRLDDVTSKVVLYRNMGFNESGEYKKTFIGSGVGKSSDDIEGYYWEYTPGMFIHLFFYVDGMVFLAGARLRSGLPKVLQREVGTDFVGGTLHTVEYHEVCTRPDIASADVGMLDGFDRGLQTDRFLWILTTSWENRSLSWIDQSQAGYMTLTKAAKEAIGLKGLAIDSGFELKIVAGIATGSLSKAIPGPRFQHRLNLLSIGIG
ncbi:hypothetical protein Tco_0175101 [Tanacetum coccineum]